MSFSIGKWAAAAMACDLVEAEFLAAVETAETVAAAVDRDEAEFVAAVETAEAVAAAVDRDGECGTGGWMGLVMCLW
ncbi:unnamed protein product, partial [Closterium sp. NIES-53]